MAIHALKAGFDRVETLQKRLEVYAPDGSTASEIEAQFSTRNVEVTHHTFQSQQPGFVLIRDAEGTFRGAVGIDTLRAVLSPEIHPPWTLADAGTPVSDLFDFLDNTLFTSYDRRQMLAVTREIEDRAWRTDAGALYAGFQDARAFAANVHTYERFARDSDVAVRVFIEDDWNDDVDDAVDVISGGGSEIGRFWFVLFDGGPRDMEACGLLAEEREPGEYYGFWTHDPVLVDELVSYLGSTYGSGDRT